MKTSIRLHFSALALAATVLAPAAHADIVTANNAGGDAYSNPSNTNQGQAIGSSGWYYNNVRMGATVGIDTATPRSGNGSVSFTSPNNGKADIEYLPGAMNVGGNYASTGSLGLFSALTSMSYDWYRDSTSAAIASQHPSLRVLLDMDGNLSSTNDRGGLVFERAYNNMSTPTDMWVSDTVAATSYLWNFGFGGTKDIDANGYAYDSNLAAWQAYLPNAKIIGFSSGVGSGWNTFNGAVDNIAWTIDGVTTSTNFEVAAANVPEPASLGLFGLALAGLAAARRRKAR